MPTRVRAPSAATLILCSLDRGDHPRSAACGLPLRAIADTPTASTRSFFLRFASRRSKLSRPAARFSARSVLSPSGGARVDPTPVPNHLASTSRPRPQHEQRDRIEVHTGMYGRIATQRRSAVPFRAAGHIADGRCIAGSRRMTVRLALLVIARVFVPPIPRAGALRSRPKAGTEIESIVRATAAYQPRKPRPRWSALRRPEIPQ